MDTSLPIIVIAYNRPKAISRLLGSLLQADYNGNTDLIISIDGGGDEAVKSIASGFEWPFGKKKLIFHEKNMGLRNHVLSCGDISQEHDGVILLEDDLFVSPGFYTYAIQAMEFYREEKQVAGISLYSHGYNETAQFPFVPLDDGSDVFFLQYASSWGQMWTKEQWKGFRDWYDAKDPKELTKGILPENIRLWPANSWKKFFIEYLIRNDLYFVFPRKSLTTIFGDEGTNIRIRETFLQEPLWKPCRNIVFTRLDESQAVYDTWCEILPERLQRLCPALEGKDFDVDLYGMKSGESIKRQYLLSTKTCRKVEISFGREMKPHEENIIHAIPGNEIFFARSTDFKDPHYFVKLLKVHEKKELSYRYPIREYHFGRKKLITTGRKNFKMLDIAFIFSKTISTLVYSWKYFF